MTLRKEGVSCKAMKRLIIVIIGGIILLVALYLFGTGILAERAVRVWLAERHIAVSEVSINYANLRSVSIANLRLGKDDNLRVTGADISYYLQGRNPVLKQADIDDLALDLSIVGDAFYIGGLEQLLGLSSVSHSKKDASIALLLHGKWNIQHTQDTYIVTISDAALSIRQGKRHLSAEGLQAMLSYHEKTQNIDGNIEAVRVQILQEDAPLTTLLKLAMSGSWKNSSLRAQGKISDSKEALPVILNLARDSKSQKTIVQWNSPQVNFKEGGLQPSVLSPLLAKVPAFSGGVRMEGSAIMQAKKSTIVAHKFTVENTELSPLLKAILKDDISVTGALSGVIPLHWSGEKAPQIVGAHLKNIGAGKLIYDPLSAEGSAFTANPQSSLLLEALKGFDYDSLTLDADSDAEGNLKAKLRIQGANPDFYQGKAVDFNLNLDGNVLAILNSESKVQEELNKQ